MRHKYPIMLMIAILLFAQVLTPLKVQAKGLLSDRESPAFSEQLPASFAQQPVISTDLFGYSNSTVTNSWINVSGGTDTGIDCTTVKSTGAIPIGFTFDYYEFSYSELYISCFGFVSFTNENLERTQPRSVPSVETPNNVIAPLWTVAESINYVHYQTLGSSPNRQFVVEWNQFITDYGSHEYNFEMILHENGDITFQYDAMSDYNGGYSRYGGIENSQGDDGLSSYYADQDFPANVAERFTRPADHANPILSPDSQGDFMAAGETINYPISLKNYSAIGTDTFTISTDSDWDITLYESDGTTPLTNPITIAQGDTYALIAAVTAPSTVNPTETNIAVITATSGVTPAVSSSVQIVNTFPAPFVQYMDELYNDDQQNSLNILPGSQTQIDFSGESVEGDQAVINLPNHNLFYTWTERNCIGEYCNDYDDVIMYTILDAAGNQVLAPTVLVDVTVMENDVRDRNAYLAVTPDGNIGVLWHREIYDSVNHISNNNAYFAILSKDGTSFIQSPQNLTNNDVFCSTWANDCVNQHSLMLASTPNGNFLLQWRDKPSYNYVFKIYDDSTSTLSSTYSLIEAASVSGYLGSFTLTGLMNNNFFIAWTYEDYVCVTAEDCEWLTEIQYTVIAGDASVTLPRTSIEDLWLMDPDSTQLSNGNIIIAHENSPETSYILFDGTTYEPITPMTLIPGQEYSDAPGVVSVLKGPYGTAVITWQNGPYESDLWQFVYALIDSDGTVKTPAISFFETGQDASGHYNYVTSELGQGSTPLFYDFAPIFTSTPQTPTYVDQTYTYNITTDDGNLPDDTLTITCLTKPDWLSFTDNGDGTATLTGTTGTPGGYPISLSVEDTIGHTTTQEYTLTVIKMTYYFFPLFTK
ncbi:MAG: hypothetical protein H0S79_05065 [Anaerolineaceae bacterium]|nr:hypothetical protein [Anaerolineaceae bacterium]